MTQPPAVAFQQARQRGLARDEQLRCQIAAVEMQQVEDVIGEAVGAAVLQIGLQQREIADAVLVFHDHFAVNERSFQAGSAATAAATGLKRCVQSCCLSVGHSRARPRSSRASMR